MRAGKIGTTGRESGRGARIAAFVLAALILVGCVWSRDRAAASAQQGAKPAAAGDAVIRAVLPDGKPAGGAIVTFGGKRYVADGQGIVRGSGIFTRPRLVTADFSRPEGGFLGLFRKSVRYAAFLPVNTSAALPPEIRLSLATVADMDEACKACHPAKATAEHPSERCVHKSGVPLKPSLLARVTQFNKENDELRKAGKPAYAEIVVEPRKLKTGLFGETRKFLVCTSCHSNHVESGYKAYVLMPFSDKSILCLGCHV